MVVIQPLAIRYEWLGDFWEKLEMRDYKVDVRKCLCETACDAIPGGPACRLESVDLFASFFGNYLV
ncbi:MAG TPA: hypothetical protein VGN34_19480 [Ktedonobacteraceae bacterium]